MFPCARGFTDEYENYVNHKLWPSQSLDLNPAEQLWTEMLDNARYHHHPNTSRGNIFCKDVLSPFSTVPEACRLYANVHSSCSRGSWWPYLVICTVCISKTDTLKSVEAFQEFTSSGKAPAMPIYSSLPSCPAAYTTFLYPSATPMGFKQSWWSWPHHFKYNNHVKQYGEDRN